MRYCCMHAVNWSCAPALPCATHWHPSCLRVCSLRQPDAELLCTPCLSFLSRRLGAQQLAHF